MFKFNSRAFFDDIKISHKGKYFIDIKDIRIEFRCGDVEHIAGLRPDYYNADSISATYFISISAAKCNGKALNNLSDVVKVVEDHLKAVNKIEKKKENENEMKIIDWERKGNVVRFKLGDKDLEDWTGDDWDDTPYEHNAGSVYGAEGYIDIAFPYIVSILEASTDYHYHGNSPFSMNDFKERKAPILIIDPTGEEGYYSECLMDNVKHVYPIFMGDKIEDIDFHAIKGIILDSSDSSNDYITEQLNKAYLQGVTDERNQMIKFIFERN